MSVSIKSLYLGELNVKNIHGPSGFELTTTAPTDNGGKGDTFSPTDLAATALSSCILTIMGIYAEKNKININNSFINIEKNMSMTAPRRISKFIVDINLPENLNSNERQKFENIVNTCPVKQSLHPDIELNVSFNYTKL